MKQVVEAVKVASSGWSGAQKIGATLASLFVGVLAVSQGVETGLNIWQGFAPLDSTVEAHDLTLEGHLLEFVDHTAESVETHEHLTEQTIHVLAVSDSILRSLERQSNQLSWLECNRLQRREELLCDRNPMGCVSPRDCSPFIERQ